jgi:acid phosphatase family membrane protein YuiD
MVMARKKITPKEFSEVATGIRLSSHEKLCAERMKVLNENINELRKEVKCLRQDMSKGKGAISVLIFIGGILGVILGYFNWE